MGSCVSHCSRQDVVHQQNESIITNVQKSVATSSGTLIQKSLLDIGVEEKAPESNEVRDKINAEIQALRDQLVRSQVIFTYLLKNSNSDNSKIPDRKKDFCSILEGGVWGDPMLQCKSFDGQVLARLYNRSNRSSSSYTSYRSTPLHYGHSLSCPILPVNYPVITKSTQTDQLLCTSFCAEPTNSNKNVASDSPQFQNKGCETFFSPPSTPCDTFPDAYLLSDICEVHQEPEEHLFPRHRTNSFISAVIEGNSKMIGEKFINNEEVIDQCQSNICNLTELTQKQTVKKNYFPDHMLASNAMSSTSVTSKIPDINGKDVPEELREFPRKLSILLEEGPEDTPGKLFSMCSSQPVLNKKKKHSSSNVKTQTDLSMSVSLASHMQIFKPEKLPIKETCISRCGYTIVSQAVQKRTIYSTELPKKLILRYPPPYTDKYARLRTYASSTKAGSTFFREFSSNRKTQMHKWATVGDSLSHKSENAHNLIPYSKNFQLQTRHLSLEKQESFSSCDHSLYPESQVSSVTDCSGWITKSDIDINLRPEPPSYQQTISSQRNYFAKNSSVDGFIYESKCPTENNILQAPGMNTFERTKSESDVKITEDSNGREKTIKCSQRSMRRGSGAGSPNSQLPRYPAFDFSEQEDVHSILATTSNHEVSKQEACQEKSVGTTNTNPTSNVIQTKDFNEAKKVASKSKTLMPEVMENSETESTKGSFEYEVPDLPTSTETTYISVPDIAFPSLPNTFLAKLGVHKNSPLPVEQFDEQDLESKFIALSLAFKTDRSTLNKRIELHKRQRDMAEKSVENEFLSMKDHLNTLNLKATSSDVRDLISKIQNHLDIAQQATARVSGRSETYGAVQQEERVCQAFEVLVLHVDHLKRLFDKEHKELEETRKILSDTKVCRKDLSPDVVSEDQKKYSKTFGLPVSSIKSVGRRRASVADFNPRSYLENYKTPSFSQSWTSGISVQKVVIRKIFIDQSFLKLLNYFNLVQ